MPIFSRGDGFFERFRQRDEDYSVDYAAAELRRPHNLPLYPLHLAAPVRLEDIQTGAYWPPDRCRHRALRFEQQAEAAVGIYGSWLDQSVGWDIQAAPIQDLEDVVTSLLLTSPPAMDRQPELAQSVQQVIERAAIDMIRHGRAVILGTSEDIWSVDIKYCWPLDPDVTADVQGWVMVRPRVSVTATDYRPNVADVFIWADGTLAGSVRKWIPSNSDTGATGTLGEELESLPTEQVQLAVADMSPIRDGWGTPWSDRLIPLAVAMARRESGLDYAVDRNERPLVQFEQVSLDMDGIYRKPGQTTGFGIEQVREIAPALRQHDVLVLTDGATPGTYLEWSGEMSASFMMLEHLGKLWTRTTGFAPIEPGDTGNVSSGIAVARRNAMGVARVRRIHSALYDALRMIIGPFQWDYVDTMLLDEGEPEEQPETEPGIRLVEEEEDETPEA